MKCLYYLAPTLPSTHQISDHLHSLGVRDFYLHVVGKDQHGLRTQQIHSANYLETLDVLRDGFIGAAIGLACGLLGVTIMYYTRPFGPDVPTFVYIVLCGLATLFGAWVGGLTGVDNENKKLKGFHADIEDGKFLVLVYVRKAQEAAVRAMMERTHPEAQLSGVDSHFINPFSSVSRATLPPVSSANAGE